MRLFNRVIRCGRPLAKCRSKSALDFCYDVRCSMDHLWLHVIVMCYGLFQEGGGEVVNAYDLGNLLRSMQKSKIT